MAILAIDVRLIDCSRSWQLLQPWRLFQSFIDQHCCISKEALDISAIFNSCRFNNLVSMMLAICAILASISKFTWSALLHIKRSHGYCGNFRAKLVRIANFMTSVLNWHELRIAKIAIDRFEMQQCWHPHPCHKQAWVNKIAVSYLDMQ